MSITESIWEGDTIEMNFPGLAATYETDVLIIGGGITGVTLAALLAEMGQPSILVEAHRIGKGTTGHSTGNLYELMDTPLTEFDAKYNGAQIRRVIEARKKGLELILDLMDRYGIDAKQRSCNMYQFSMDADNVNLIQSEFSTALALNVPVREATDEEIPLPSFSGFKLERQAQINPLRYITELSQKISPELVELFEASAVIDIQRDKDMFTVHTADGTIHAKNIVHATHIPKGVLFEQTLLGPYREYGIACRLSHTLPFNGIYWGQLKNEKFSVRFYEIEDVPYVLVIGKRHKTGNCTNNELLIKGLKEFAYQYFPIQSVVYSWGGQHYRPADLLPYIGEIGSNEYMATGYATDGLVYGTLAAFILRDLILDENNEFAKLFSPSRFNPLKSAKNFVRENMDVAGKLVKRVFDLKAYHDRDFSKIQTGTGEVIDHGGHKLAVYRAPDRKLIVKSAVCPHMGCIVQFNSAEQSWDCPCHGSRFAVTGEVLEGPSLEPLASISGNKGKVEIIDAQK